jgi:integrase
MRGISDGYAHSKQRPEFATRSPSVTRSYEDRGLGWERCLFRYVPSEEDFWTAYDAAVNQQDKAMLHTGARRSEVFRLTWEDVDFGRKQIRFGTRKTGHGGWSMPLFP